MNKKKFLETLKVIGIMSTRRVNEEVSTGEVINYTEYIIQRISPKVSIILGCLNLNNDPKNKNKIYKYIQLNVNDHLHYEIDSNVKGSYITIIEELIKVL